MTAAVMQRFIRTSVPTRGAPGRALSMNGLTHTSYRRGEVKHRIGRSELQDDEGHYCFCKGSRASGAAALRDWNERLGTDSGCYDRHCDSERMRTLVMMNRLRDVPDR